MIDKYFACFDENGELLNLCTTRLPECGNTNCKEHVLKLIPIDRSPEEFFKEELDYFMKKIKEHGKLNTKFDKMVKELGRII